MPVTVTTSKRLKEGIDGELAQSQSSKEVYLLRLSGVSGTTTPQEVIAASGHAIGDAGAGGLVLQSINAKPETPDLWKVTLSYAPPTTGSVNLDPADPDYKPEIAFGRWSFQRVIEVDQETGDPVQTSSEEKFDPPPVIEVSYPQISVTVRKAAAPIADISLVGYINDASVTIIGITIPKYCGMLSDVSITPAYDADGNAYFLCRYTININRNRDAAGALIGFKAELLDAGYYHLFGGAKVPTAIKGQLVSKPQKLDGSGGVLAVAAPSVYLTFCLNPLTDFSAFSLPATYPSY